MKPSARIQTTIEVLEKIAKSRLPMDSTIGDYMRVRRYIGAKDRAEIAQRLYGVMRAYARLGWWVERTGVEDTPRSAVLLYMLLAEGCELKRLEDLCDGATHAPAELSATEKAAAGTLVGQGLDHAEMPPSVRVECPPLYEPQLRAYFGEAFEEELGAMLSAAPLDLRVNTFLTDRDKVQKQLEKEGVTCAPTPYSPWGLRARGKAYLARTKAMVKGWVEIQDEGSQLIAWICGATPGAQVLDYCAGAGGKTLALAAAMQRKGRIVAMDLDEKRLAKGRERFRKAQLSDIIEVRPLQEEKQKKWLKRQKQTFDVVLLDVPCTGTGTWRRNPDMRWKVYGPPLEELLPVQADILERVVHTVKPGGRLVYATCSLLPEENEQQIAAFLARHPEFEVLPLAVILNERSEMKDPAGDQEILRCAQDDRTGFMRLTPHRHQTDGFFAAVLIRKNDV